MNKNVIILTFHNHISIKKIKEYFPDGSSNNFEFTEVSQDEVKKEVLHLNVKKSLTSSSIPAKILKYSIETHLPFSTNSINYTIKNSEFPDKLKKSEVIPLYKKKDPLKKENYRPVSPLPHVSKVFERVIYKQINSYMEDKRSKYITGFTKAHGTQQSLITMLQKWKSVLDKGEYVCCLFMHLSKVFDTINRDFLLAQLKAYGFSHKSLALMCAYLKNKTENAIITLIHKICHCRSSIRIYRWTTIV